MFCHIEINSLWSEASDCGEVVDSGLVYMVMVRTWGIKQELIPVLMT